MTAVIATAKLGAASRALLGRALAVMFVALGVLLDPVLSVGAAAQSAAPPQIRINARVEGWDELSFEPRTWRCGGCDPPIMVTAQQSSVAWQAHDPQRMRVADSQAFADMVLADPGQRADFVENLLGHLRQRFPAHEVRATLSGRKTIGGFAFIEAQVTLRRDSDLTSMASYTAVHKGAMIQLAAMYVVFGPRPLAVREIERFLSGVSIEE